MDRSSAIEAGKRSGFDLEGSFILPEIDGDAYVYRHRESGARLLLLANDDPDKSFSISFKTPAFDNTGVFHILEHSVLCGSDKFPVKEPFVTLLKTSMQTFLNAMTFPDKTMYPVASTNERDLMNLMDVYLDAVFHPLIYRDPLIFEQEGWHLEFDAEDGGELVYNGVVYNEMKGALSDPEQVLYDTLSEALFPDTTYRFESGGDPSFIPDLTYQQFIDTHSTRYTPENSYIVLYGDLDADAFMSFIDENYLTPISEGRDRAQTPSIDLQDPVINTGIRRQMATSPEGSCAAFGYVVGSSADRLKIAASSILMDAVMGSNEAPLKRALLDADIAEDCDSFVSDSVLQPFVTVMARGLHDDAVARMEKVIRETVSRLCAGEGSEGSLDETLIEASLAHAEFAMREFDFGYSDGVMLSMAAMSGWLYDDSPEAAVSYIRYEGMFAELRKRLGTGYYTELLSAIFLENGHYAQAEIVPVAVSPEPESIERLAMLQESMDGAARSEIMDNVAKLREAQTSADDPEKLAKLPHLTRQDIGNAPTEPAVDISDEGGVTLLRHHADTHGITYFSYYYDAGSIAFEDLPYLSLLAVLLGKLDTKSHTAAEIDTLVQSKMGSLSFSCEVFLPETSKADSLNPDREAVPRPMVKFVSSGSSLEDRTRDAEAIVREILLETDFSDDGRILDILRQRKVGLEQRFTNAGNAVAVSRAESSISEAHAISEMLDGIEHYIRLKRIISGMESGDEDISGRLQEIISAVCVKEGAIVSFSGSERSFAGRPELPFVADHATGESVLRVPELSGEDSAYAVPTDVAYSALVANRKALDPPYEYSGIWQVLSRILSFDYLWNRVRVIGGAYGVGFGMTRSGMATFHSFRDPHVSETLESFGQTAAWLKDFNPGEDEFEGYVVSTAASIDKPMKPRSLVRRQANMFITGYTREAFLEHRRQIVDCSIEDIKGLAKPVEDLCENSVYCVVGSRDLIADAGLDVDAVDLFES